MSLTTNAKNNNVPAIHRNSPKLHGIRCIVFDTKQDLENALNNPYQWMQDAYQNNVDTVRFCMIGDVRESIDLHVASVLSLGRRCGHV